MTILFGMSIWDRIYQKFGNSEKKICVIKSLLMYGLRVTEKGIFIGEKIKIPYTSIAAALDIDRRTVMECVREIRRDPLLKTFFGNLEPAGASLKNVARILGYRCLVIETYEDKPGILASVARILAEKNINILQVIAEDPNLISEPKLYLIVSSNISGDVIDKLLKLPIIKYVTIS